MTTRNLDALFAPKAIALIGASNRAGSVGAVLARNLFDGGFAGPVMTVNPHEAAIRSSVNYRSVAELPITPDLAVIATPAASVPGLVAELGARGCRAAVVISAGFGEAGLSAGAALRQTLLDAAKPYLMRIIGPNGLGVLSPGLGINASFAQFSPASGDLAFITQSGAVATTMLDWAAGRGLGFSHLVSLGDMADVDFGDMLDHLATDKATRAILLYVETITSARKFMSAARVAARAKPVIVVKAGRSAAGARATLSHTGALAGSDAVYDAAFRRAGMLRVDDLRSLFDAAATLSCGMTVAGDRLTVLTNGGGVGVMAVDALEQGGGRMAPLTTKARDRLETALPPMWSRNNPVDILGDAGGDRYGAALRILCEDGDQDAVLVLNCPTGVADSTAGAKAVLAALPPSGAPAILTAWLGDPSAQPARRLLREGGLPSFETPEEAVQGFLQLAAHHRHRQQLMQTPPADNVASRAAVSSARAIVDRVIHDGRTLLNEPEAKALLAAFGVPVVETRIARTPGEARAEAEAMGGPFALKILSPDITHKSDAGGVRLDLADGAAVEDAAIRMRATVAARAPGARIEGFTVQPMIRRPGAVELLLGIADDATFGPVLMVGQGGVAVEVANDRAMALPPLNSLLAREMIGRTRVSRLLAGYRDVAPADVEAVADILVKLSDLAAQVPQIAELDINPLLVDAAGAVALDARVVVRAVTAKEADRFAIRPYPSELAEEIAWSSGAPLQLRPIRPQDEAALVAMLGRCTPDDLRMETLGRASGITHEAAARLTQIDYDREMTLVAFEADGAMAGFVRLFSDPNFEAAEFDLLVRTDLKRRGLGRRLLQEILAYARSRGVAVVVGQALISNGAMVDLARRLGGAAEADGSGALQLRFDLAERPLREST